MAKFEVTIKRITTETLVVEHVEAEDEDAAVENTIKEVEADPGNDKYKWELQETEIDYQDVEEEEGDEE